MIYLQYSPTEAKKLRINAPTQRWAIANQVDLDQVIQLDVPYELWANERYWRHHHPVFLSTEDHNFKLLRYMPLAAFTLAKLDTPLKDYL